MDYPLDPRLSDLTIRDLPLNRRQQLSSYLNSEQLLMSETGFARDYRGIAQQLELPYSEIAKLSNAIDPTGTLLSYQMVNKLTVRELLRLVQVIGRFDILDDLMPGLMDDLEHLDLGSTKDELLLYSPSSESTKIWYDAYICYADSDLEFVRSLVSHLESPKIGLRLFIRDRDLMAGHWVYETFAQLIESQCRRVIVILSPDFLNCSDCKFQSQFATGLAIEKRNRILIPIIYKQCDIPSIIRLLSKIDMTGTKLQEWSMKRLIMSIQDQPSNNNRAIEYSPPLNNRPLITYDSSSNNTTNNNNNTSNSSNIVELVDNLPSPSTSEPWTKSCLDTTVSTLSNLSMDEPDSDQKRLLINRANSLEDNNNRTQLIADLQNNNNSNNTRPTTANKGKEWFNSIKRKIKVRLAQ